MRIGLLTAAMALLAAAAPAETPARTSSGKPTPAPAGYLADSLPDTIAILPPAPVAGSTRYEADRTLFLSTRRLRDTPRWALARGDVDQRAILKDMACAAGVELTPANAPKTAALVSRVLRDVSRATTLPKDLYRRQRPYLIDEGPICVDKTPDLAASPDYPSGHTTWGWTVGLILAELAPDRATPILVRARAYGESRLVCGVHNLSAVEAGRTNASIGVAALHGNREFRRDLDAARQEVAAARKAGPAPDPSTCAAEAALLASPY
jgi:acid phosphatase (class A)